MGNHCTSSPKDKKAYITEIGKLLIEVNGKKEYYKPIEVKNAHRKTKWYEYNNINISCWAMSVFSSHSDFDNYHKTIGEFCDYSEMKKEMLSGLSKSKDIVWTEILEQDIDSSWIDFGDVFEGVLDGIGDFFGGIFDGV